MLYDLNDLTEVMETRSAGRLPSPDLLANVRRRTRRGRQVRLVAGAAGTVLAFGTAFVGFQLLGQTTPPEQRQAMTGVPNEAFLHTRPKEGMQPLREVRYAKLGRKARLTFTPTGPSIMITFNCSIPSTVYLVQNGVLSSGECHGRSAGEDYLRTEPGVPVTIDVAALPGIETARPSPEFTTVADMDRYLAAHQPTPGAWSVLVYSGRCIIEACTGSNLPRPEPPVQGMTRLAHTTNVADGHGRSISFTPTRTSVRLRVICLDGAAVAVVKSSGHVRVVDCEAAEFKGVVWDRPAQPGVRTTLTVAVLPAEAGKVTATSDTALAKLMKGVKPAGKWTLDVYAR